ncbi:CPBP family intramembrane metalloprotease [Candidatus Thorarchaeota archaeon]|nr:MAG: CPBP family intramembrane metalloprotease [Candidatus Thorarchaeota archaeon]
MCASRKQVIRIIVAVILGLFVLFAASVLAIIGSQFVPDTLGLLGEMGFLTHTGMLTLSILLIWLLSKGNVADYGLRRPFDCDWTRVILLSIVIGILVASIRTAVMGGEEGTIEDYFGIQIMIGVWVYASVAEEFLTRGLIQGYLEPLAEPDVTSPGTRISAPVLVGALFFALMHFAMVTLGLDITSVLATVVSAFLMGIIAGHYREKTGSLAPSILVHMLFNITGSIVFFLSGLL